MPVPRSLQPFVHIIRGHPAVNNTGSFARDSLANERTYLSWTRTALSLVFLGIGLERFETLREDIMRIPLLTPHPSLAPPPLPTAPLFSTPTDEDDGHSPFTSLLTTYERLSPNKKVSLLLSGSGAVIAVQSTWRYFTVLHELQNGTNTFKPNVRGVVFVAASSIAVVVTILRGHNEHFKETAARQDSA